MGGMAIAGLGSAVSGGLSFLGSQGQASAAKESAQMQAYMGMQAIAEQRRQYEQTRSDLAPYRNAGATGANMLTERLPYLTSPITMDQATLESTPGYAWNLSQGLKATQNSAAARGLGVSGAALKGAATYATGLADSTYQNQFNNENTNRTNAYNRLLGTSQLGASASGATGMLGANAANQTGNLLTGIGNAYGAAGMAGANAGYNALTGVGNAANGLSGIYLQSYLKNNNGNAVPGGLYANEYDPLQGYNMRNDNGGY